MTRSKNNQIQVLLPEGWEDGTIYSFLGPERAGQRSMVTLCVDPSAGAVVPLDEYARTRAAQVMDSLAEPEVLKEESRKLANGREVYEFAYRAGVGSERAYVWLAFMIERGAGYMFYGRAMRSTRELTAAAFRQIIESFTPGA